MTAFWSDHATLPAIVLATFAPFAAFFAIMLFTRGRPRLSARLSIGAISVSLACALYLPCVHWRMEQPLEYTAQWIASGSFSIPFGFLVDPLSLLMLTIVAAISFLVQMYSLGYMAGDPGFSRYYAFMSLFAWAMMSLTVASTVLQLFIFWELVGLSSYLLIGFWFEKFSATQAGKKAFVMTRVGDASFYIGLLLVLLHMGNLDILELGGPKATESMSPGFITLAALLVFGGIVGKSAQFPLLTWLPDAMEGPTPVSALLHSATMVAAGVYLFARLFPFFSLSSTAMTVILAVGTISMLLASTMAMVSRDIKRVWAYSTISQLGLMIMALAAGGWFAGVFHLTTHAGFKALLFLCSGVFLHTYETGDIFELSARGGRNLKIPALTLAVGAAALSGLPPFSGYFSKGAVMGALSGLTNPIWALAALVGVLLTAYYSFRVVFVIFFPGSGVAESSVHSHAAGEGHEGGHAETYRAMAWPLLVLAGVTLILGFFEAPLRGFLFGGATAPEAHESVYALMVHYAAIGLGLLGVAAALVEFGWSRAKRVGLVERWSPALANLFAERWFLDHFYRAFMESVIDKGFASLAHWNDRRVIDGTIDGAGRRTIDAGRRTALWHLGAIQRRLLTTFAVVAFLALYFFL